MIITQNKFLQNINIAITPILNYSSIILVYKSTEDIDILSHSLVTASNKDLILSGDGLYTLYEYSVLTSTLPVDRTTESLYQFLGTQNPRDTESILHIYNINKCFVDITQDILEDLLIQKEVYKNIQLQNILDMGIMMMDNLFGGGLYLEANRILTLLIPFTSNE